MIDLVTVNATHDPTRRSWLESANRPNGDFPIQNLPFAIFRDAHDHPFRGGVAIGDQILDLGSLADAGAFAADDLASAALAAARESTLNSLMGLGARHASALRRALSDALCAGSPLEPVLRARLRPQATAQFAVPAQIGDFTDFYASIHHATSVGRLFRPDNPLLPNYTWVPIGYHGRSSSIAVSGQSFHRPRGQRLPPGDSAPVMEASQRVDYEVELGVFIGPGNELGAPIAIDEADEHVFGICLLNDWSARDLQAWEYQPLGPFLAKNFATTISPWIVTLEALAPFRTPFQRQPEHPAPLAYLAGETNRRAGSIDIRLETFIETAAMRARCADPIRLSSTSFRHSYWTVAQLIAHHTVNGCNLRPGDLLGSGTQSGPGAGEAGSLLELSIGGKQPIDLGEGERRAFLEDGDRVIIRGFCEAPGRKRIGFGEVCGELLAAKQEGSR